MQKKKKTNIKDPYKKSKDSKKSGPSPQFFSFYDKLDEIWGTRDAIILQSI